MEQSKKSYEKFPALKKNEQLNKDETKVKEEKENRTII